MAKPRVGRMGSFLVCAVAYLAAAAAAAVTCQLASSASPFWQAALADVVATVVVFAFSLGADNSSMYDPYWSVAPVAIAAFWLARLAPVVTVRRVVVLILVLYWAARLTGNWVRRWRGLADEDWRYAEYRRFGAAYWPVSFFGFHFFPTVLVFFGCLSLAPVLLPGAQAFSMLDIAAFIVTAAAVCVETAADWQLVAFIRSRPQRGEILATGLWSLSRHPNYFGEVLFWWGIYLFGLAANPGWWWTIVGPVAITGLFLGISVPMMDRHMLARHPGYAAHMTARSAFLPWPTRRQAEEEDA
jgi:steroid 5-alpha reductase family enzyme